MPGKTSHGRHNKKRKYRLESSAIQKTQAAQPRESVVSAHIATSPVNVPVSSSSIQVPYVISELRRIGILSGAVLIVLIVLALVFS